jgi:hypothetical protein
MSRASRSTKVVYTARLNRTLSYLTGLLPPEGISDRRARAILMISAMLGVINLSCRVGPKAFTRDSPTDSRSVNQFEQNPRNSHRRLMYLLGNSCPNMGRPLFDSWGLLWGGFVLNDIPMLDQDSEKTPLPLPLQCDQSGCSILERRAAQ